jgi:crotonobetainyl-CoA:carnitine CoA-transferase CaiB-like acyl-CoA transferase
MASEDFAQGNALPLSGFRVLEISRTVAAAYAGRLLAAVYLMERSFSGE